MVLPRLAPAVAPAATPLVAADTTLRFLMVLQYLAAHHWVMPPAADANALCALGQALDAVLQLARLPAATPGGCRALHTEEYEGWLVAALPEHTDATSPPLLLDHTEEKPTEDVYTEAADEEDAEALDVSADAYLDPEDPTEAPDAAAAAETEKDDDATGAFAEAHRDYRRLQLERLGRRYFTEESEDEDDEYYDRFQRRTLLPPPPLYWEEDPEEEEEHTATVTEAAVFVAAPPLPPEASAPGAPPRNWWRHRTEDEGYFTEESEDH